METNNIEILINLVDERSIDIMKDDIVKEKQKQLVKEIQEQYETKNPER